MSPASRVRAVAGAAALALLLFVVLPASLYLGNVHEFMTAPASLAGVLLVPVLLVVAVAIVGLRLRGGTDFSRFTSLTAALTVLAWTQAYLLVWDYGPLDGSQIEWGPAWRGLDLLVWLAGLTVATVWHRRLVRPLSGAAFAIVALQVLILLSQAWERRDVLALKPSRHAAANRLDAMARFSPERNVLHLVLDSFQADVFKDIVDGPARDYFRPALTGFTFFEEHLGTFPATYLALPVIVSGQAYRNHIPRPQFMEQAFAGTSVLNAAHAAGFEVDIASEPMMLDMLMQGRHDNAYLVGRRPLIEDAARLVDIALFRGAPHWLKPLVYNEQRWLTQRFSPTSELMRFHYFRHNSFLADVTHRFSADRRAPVYKFFHLMQTHAPFVVEPDCSYAGTTVGRVRETVTAQSQCSLAFVIALLDRLKQAGLYDSTLIVLMADHGGHIPPHRYVPGSFTQDGLTYELQPSLVGLATPLLAIKPPGATHPFRVSSALTSMTDVAATIDALAGLDGGLPGRSIMDVSPDPTAERRFFGYEWSKKDPISDYIGIIQEYRVTGSAYRIESWQVEAFYPHPDRDARR